MPERYPISLPDVMLPNPPGRIIGGEIFLDGTDLLALDEADMSIALIVWPLANRM